MLKKKQHYIQKAYIRGFSPYYFDECEKWKKDQIFVLDKKSRVISQTIVDKVGYRDYYYSFYDKSRKLNSFIEDQFSQIENDFITFRNILRSVIDNINITGEVIPIKEKSRSDICEYVKLYFVRIPKVMDWIYEESKKHEEKLSKKLVSPFNEIHYKNISIKAMLKILNQKEYNIVEHLYKRDISFEFFGRTKGSFVTSDNPVIRVNRDDYAGLAYTGTNIIFPIDRNKIVRFVYSDKKDKYIKIQDLSIIDTLNDLQYENAVKEVYGSSEEVLKKILDRQEKT